MPLVSAGLLMYRWLRGELEVFLAHPGGPFFARKDSAAWTIPKGLVGESEELVIAAEREFREETGLPVTGPLLPLGSIRQSSGKIVHAWAFEGDAPAGFVPNSNTFEMEWPPRSGTRRTFPEIDRAEFFGMAVAREKIILSQAPLLERLRERLMP